MKPIHTAEQDAQAEGKKVKVVIRKLDKVETTAACAEHA
jgi:hypothetical protein